MATISYTTYQFNPPPLLIKGDYETLKGILMENPSYNINPPSSFVKQFKVALVIISVGAFGGFLAYLELADWLSFVGAIPAIIAFFSLFSLVPSMFSFLGFLNEKSNYYSDLKKDILKSNDYNEFLSIRRNRTWS